MDTYIIITLFIAFFIMEFIQIHELHSIINEKVLLSGLYSLIGWSIYFLGIYELIENIYYAIPSIIGAVCGQMIAMHLKKIKKKNLNEDNLKRNASEADES